MSTPDLTCVALIPARAGSKRIISKNIRILHGHPLIAYTISAALESKIFSAVIVSTDSQEIADIAQYYGAEVPFLRPPQFAEEKSPDIEWLEYTIKELEKSGKKYDCFSILRPTSPFRKSATILEAWEKFCSDDTVHSLRAVEKCSQHPAKMWQIKDKRMVPVMRNPDPKATPWYSTPYQALPEIYTQNASLEIARTEVLIRSRTISGTEIMPFITDEYDGFDINTKYDWEIAENLTQENLDLLPKIEKTSYRSEVLAS